MKIKNQVIKQQIKKIMSLNNNNPNYEVNNQKFKSVTQINK